MTDSTWYMENVAIDKVDMFAGFALHALLTRVDLDLIMNNKIDLVKLTNTSWDIAIAMTTENNDENG